MSNVQRDAAVVGELAYRLKARCRHRVAKEVSDFHAIRVELITAIQQLEGLPGASCAGAQHRVDQDALLSEVSAYLLRIPFTVWDESSLAVPAQPLPTTAPRNRRPPGAVRRPRSATHGQG